MSDQVGRWLESLRPSRAVRDPEIFKMQPNSSLSVLGCFIVEDVSGVEVSGSFPRKVIEKANGRPLVVNREVKSRLLSSTWAIPSKVREQWDEKG